MSAGIICFILSTTYHLFSSYSPYIQELFSRLDYSGIAILIAGSTFPPIVYGFDCYPRTKYIYLGLITSACVLSFVITLLPNSDKPKYRMFRGFLFIVVGLLAGSPAVHALISQNPKIFITPFLWALGGGVYIAGALLYVARVPERFAPGVFDYFVTLSLMIGAKSQLVPLFCSGSGDNPLLGKHQKLPRASNSLLHLAVQMLLLTHP